MFQVELRRPKERCWCCVVAILSASFPEAFAHVVVAIASAAALVHPAPACPSEEMVALCVGEWSGGGGGEQSGEVECSGQPVGVAVRSTRASEARQTPR